jgi:hypothetical protein
MSRSHPGWFWPTVRTIVPSGLRPSRYLTRLVQERTGLRIRKGPFAGMNYGERAICSAYIPKLLGIYERELNQEVELACARRCQRIINIGAGEGYYAVGLALRNPAAQVIAFETEAAGRTALRELCCLNGVERRVEIVGRCDRPSLATALTGGLSNLIICDAEGGELDLLAPRSIPELSSAAVLVEVHEFAIPGTADALVGRFQLTHQIRRIWQEPRVPSDFPFEDWYTRLLPERFITWAVSEWRPERMSWLWMLPQNPAAAPRGAESSSRAGECHG